MKIENCKLIIEGLLDSFFPKKCIGCKKEGQYICKDCEIFLSELPPITETYMTEAKPLSPSIVSVWEYEGIIEKAIRKIKFDGQYHIIDELVEKAFEKIELNLAEDTCITFVPMYKKKEKQRGFNQAEIIARKIGEKTNRKVVPLLTKIKDNRSQVGLSPKERLDNVLGVFAPAPKIFKASPCMIKSVLLVNDVYTTGATMKEGKKILQKLGIKNILGFALSRRLRL